MSDEFYDTMVEHLRAAVAAGTGRPTFTAEATGLPALPYCVVQALGHSGRFEHSVREDNVTTSVYVQVEGIGETWRDSLWMVDRAAASIRAMTLPAGAADVIVTGRSSPFPLGGEGVVGLAQRLSVRATKAAA